MELHTKQLQTGMNSAVAAQLWAPLEMHTGSPQWWFLKERISKALLYKRYYSSWFSCRYN